VDDTSVFEHTEYHGHRQVMFFSDEASSLRAIIAIHRLRSGRSGGGIRFYPYASGAAALTDVLRLSRAMSYKMVLCGVPVGAPSPSSSATRGPRRLLSCLGPSVGS
jgi:leucine dehydrogenase